MEISDDELEWRERVARAEREDFDQIQRSKRPFWQIMLEEVWMTGGRIFVILLLLFAALMLLLGALMPYIPAI